MKLSILGSGTSIPSKTRGNPGYVLQSGTNTILIDGGAGALRKLPLLGISMCDITKICYSHLHVDHIHDLVPLLFAYKNPTWGVVTDHKVEIFAHHDFSNHFQSLQNIYGRWISSDNVEIVIRPVLDSVVKLNNDFTIKTAQVLHTPQSIAYRFETNDGKSIVYSGDTDYCDNLVRISRCASLLIIECSFPDNSGDSDGHMTPKKVAQLIKEAQPGRVLLTHIYPENDNDTLIERVGNDLNIRIEVAEDLMQIDV